MTFYRDCLGGELYLQAVGDSPVSKELPGMMKKCIVHSSLKKNNLVIMGTDMVGEKGLNRGNNVSILIQCENREEMNRYYNKLSEKGQSTHPIEKTFWGDLFGSLIDKYGNHWLLNYHELQPQNT